MTRVEWNRARFVILIRTNRSVKVNMSMTMVQRMCRLLQNTSKAKSLLQVLDMSFLVRMMKDMPLKARATKDQTS